MSISIRQCSLGVAIVVMTACNIPASMAQGAAAFPSRTVTLVSPYPPGGGADGDGRVWSQKLTEIWGKPVVVDYKAGGGSTIGTNYVVKAPPDGHTLLLITAGFTVTAVMHPDLPYDPVKDLAPVSLTHKRAALFVAHPSMPFKTFPEFVAHAKANPEKLNFGTTGAGSIYHLLGAWLNNSAGIKTTLVHYKGSGPMLVDIVAGRTQVAPTTFLTGWPFVASGKLRALATISMERSHIAPDLKTVAEQGIADFDYSSWGGILAPAGVPAPILDKISGQFAAFAKDPATIEQYKKTGAILVGNSPAEFRKYIVTEITRWGRLMKENGIQPGTDG